MSSDATPDPAPPGGVEPALEPGGTPEPAPTGAGGRRALAYPAAALLALAGALLWALLTAATGRRLAVIAVVAGILIGLVLRRVGGLSGRRGGAVAAAIAVGGALLGLFLEAYAVQAHQWSSTPFADPRHQDWNLFRQLGEWGFGEGWRNFGDTLSDPLSLLTLVLAGAAAFVYVSDSGRAAAPQPEAGEDRVEDAAPVEDADRFEGQDRSEDDGGSQPPGGGT